MVAKKIYLVQNNFRRKNAHPGFLNKNGRFPVQSPAYQGYPQKCSACSVYVGNGFYL